MPLAFGREFVLPHPGLACRIRLRRNPLGYPFFNAESDFSKARDKALRRNVETPRRNPGGIKG